MTMYMTATELSRYLPYSKFEILEMCKRGEITFYSTGKPKARKYFMMHEVSEDLRHKTKFDKILQMMQD